jgi:hypothetical protein
MLENIIISCTGLIGAIIGSGITILYQSVVDNRKEFKERKNECLKTRKGIIIRLDKTEQIIRTIIAFIRSDFSCINGNEEGEEEAHYIYNSIMHIYNDHSPYFWDDFITDIYNLMPKTAGKECFQILNKLMLETRQMSSKIFDFIDGQNENLQELQARFLETGHNYTTAMYAIQLLKEEFQKNIIKKTNINTSKKYYKNNKILIRKSIKELNSNMI